MSKFTHEISKFPSSQEVRDASADQLGIIRRWVEANPAPKGVQKLRLQLIEERSQEIARLKLLR